MLSPLIGYSQNLVPNPSFEILDTCPTTEGQLFHAIPWFSPTYNTINYPMSDFFNTCAPQFPVGANVPVGVPFNCRGYEYPHTGNSYAGACVYSDYDETREYISVKLNYKLQPGLTYCLGYYVSLSNYDTTIQPNGGSRFAIDCMGIYISDTIIHLNTWYAIPVTPQIINPPSNFLSDTTNWMLVSGTYIAHGGEQYITIGNFKNDSNTQSYNFGNIIPNHGAYYYIDDVSVMDCSDTIGINEVVEKEENISVYPNPAKDKLNVIATLPLNTSGEINIYDAIGNKVLTLPLTEGENNLEVNMSNISAGVYFYKVIVENQTVKSDKLVIIK